MCSRLAKYGYLSRRETLFLLCDVQERFRSAMKFYDAIIKNSDKLIKAGKKLEVPLIATEHYPEKLGNIVKELDISHAKAVFSKTLFSMMIPEMKNKIEQIFDDQLRSVVLFGIETHICVEQTAMDFITEGYTVHIAADCCMSRLLQDRSIALKRLEKIGCIVTTSESIIFKLMKNKNHSCFDEIRKLVTEPSDEIPLS